MKGTHQGMHRRWCSYKVWFAVLFCSGLLCMWLPLWTEGGERICRLCLRAGGEEVRSQTKHVGFPLKQQTKLISLLFYESCLKFSSWYSLSFSYCIAAKPPPASHISKHLSLLLISPVPPPSLRPACPDESKFSSSLRGISAERDLRTKFTVIDGYN